MLKLLIIDDNVEITDMLKQYLEFADFEVTVANDGKNGIKLLSQQDYDRIILDIAMPEFSGLDVLETLKERNFKDFKKITILSASSIDAETESKINSLAVNAIIEKPINMNDLVKKIQD